MPPVEEKEDSKETTAKGRWAKAGEKGARRQFVLKAGIHTGPDYSKKPIKRKEADDTVTERYPGKTYRAGDVVEDDGDLVKAFGVEKFGYAGAKSASAKARSIDRQVADLQKQKRAALDAEMAEAQGAGEGPRVESTILNPCPHGQVIEGYQGTTAGVSGMAHPEAKKVVAGSQKETKGHRRAPVPPPELTHPGITPETSKAARSAEGKTAVEDDADDEKSGTTAKSRSHGHGHK